MTSFHDACAAIRAWLGLAPTERIVLQVKPTANGARVKVKAPVRKSVARKSTKRGKSK